MTRQTQTPNPNPNPNPNPTQTLSKEETDLWATLSKELQSPPPSQSQSTTPDSGIHPAVALGLFGALIAHGAIIFSLPPVLRGKGAPFLPTGSDGMNVMFQQLRRQPYIRNRMNQNKINHRHFNGNGNDNGNNNGNDNDNGTSTHIHTRIVKHNGSPSSTCSSSNANTTGSNTISAAATSSGLNFVDLGSGDGRVVFRAAREGIFTKSIGYEINPVLHAWANIRRIVQAPTYYQTTKFHMKDLWKVNLSNADVVAVYGLHPIMDKLGTKMKHEMKHGAIVVSNVFTIPGWKPISSNVSDTHRVHMYSIPESIERSSTSDSDSAVTSTTTSTSICGGK